MFSTRKMLYYSSEFTKLFIFSPVHYGVNFVIYIDIAWTANKESSMIGLRCILWRHNCWDEIFLLPATWGEEFPGVRPSHPSWPWHFNRSTLAALGLGLLLFTHKYTFYSVHLFQIFTYRYKVNVSGASQSASPPPLVFPPIWILPWVTWDGNVRSQADVDQDNPDKCDKLDKFQVKIINNYPW